MVDLSTVYVLMIVCLIVGALLGGMLRRLL